MLKPCPPCNHYNNNYDLLNGTYYFKCIECKCAYCYLENEELSSVVIDLYMGNSFISYILFVQEKRTSFYHCEMSGTIINKKEFNFIIDNINKDNLADYYFNKLSKIEIYS